LIHEVNSLFLLLFLNFLLQPSYVWLFYALRLHREAMFKMSCITDVLSLPTPISDAAYTIRRLMSIAG
jgi:ACR3 family arsenite efflux pump ArsB